MIFLSFKNATISVCACLQVTMYSAAWVRSQSRMSSTSNQETYRCRLRSPKVASIACFEPAPLVSFALPRPAQLPARSGTRGSQSLVTVCCKEETRLSLFAWRRPRGAW